MEEVSRRSFLKGSALAAAGVAGATALAGCAGNDAALSDTGSTPEWMPETWDYETDVLVIGYGGAGLWAGITAYDEGAQVLYLEKSPFRGGGSSSINMGQLDRPPRRRRSRPVRFRGVPRPDPHGSLPGMGRRGRAEPRLRRRVRSRVLSR